MDLKQLMYYTAIVDAGSISAAAKKLHISQPPLSHQMKLLENELGVVLFERGIRRITLTDAGKLMYTRAKAILDMASSTKMEMNYLGNQMGGTIRIGMVSSTSIGEIAWRFRTFKKLYPQVQYQIYEGNTYQMLDALKTNQIDLALARTPFPVDGLMCQKFDEEYFVGVGLSELLPESEGIEGLSGQPLIVYRRWEPVFRQTFESQQLRFYPICISDNAWTCIQMARAGMGIAIVPESFAKEHLDLSVYTIKNERMKSQLMLIRRDDHDIPNVTKQFYETFDVSTTCRTKENVG